MKEQVKPQRDSEPEREMKNLISSDGVTIYAYENAGCDGPFSMLTSTGASCEAISNGIHTLYGTFSCHGMSAGSMVGCTDSDCKECATYNLRPQGESGQEQCSLLGAPGIATRSKDATRGSWHRY